MGSGDVERASAGALGRRAEVLCCGCGAWFEPAEFAPRIRCPLCAADVLLGALHRTRRRVPHTGRIDMGRVEAGRGGDPAGRRLGRVVWICVMVGTLAALTWFAIEALPELAGTVERLGRAARRTAATELTDDR